MFCQEPVRRGEILLGEWLVREPLPPTRPASSTSATKTTTSTHSDVQTARDCGRGTGYSGRYPSTGASLGARCDALPPTHTLQCNVVYIHSSRLYWTVRAWNPLETQFDAVEFLITLCPVLRSVAECQCGPTQTVRNHLAMFRDPHA